MGRGGSRVPGGVACAARRRPAWAACAWAALAAASLASCAAPRIERPDWPEYRAFLVPQPLAPIEASGSARFEFRGDKQTGSVLVQGRADHGLLIRIISPVLGTTALEARLTPATLLVVDYGSETYYLGANTPDHRDKLFALDMTPEEFLIVLTGRVPRAAFEAGQGRIDGDTAVFGSPEAVYRFTLNGEGLPDSAVKLAPDGRGWRVEYREYQPVPTGPNGSLLLPRKVRVFAGDPAPRLILGIAEIQLWPEDGSEPLSLEPPEGMTFQGLEGE